MSRTAEQIRAEWLSDFIPPGAPWNRSADGNLAKLLLPFCVTLAQIEGDIESLALEISPQNATKLLADYEAVLGSDPCGRDQGVLTIAQRQQLAFQRWIASGGQSLAYYQQMAAAAGYSITITEIEPYVCDGDDAVCGDAVCSTPADLAVVVITLPNRNTGLECPILRNKQAETEIVFEYADEAA